MTPISTDPISTTTYDRLSALEGRTDDPPRPKIDPDAVLHSPPKKEEIDALVAFASAKPIDDKQKKIDAFFEAACATYAFRDEQGKPCSAQVPFQFRMAGGYAAHAPETMKRMFAEAILHPSPDLARAFRDASLGKATPEQVKLVTQALIDAGKLHVEENEDPAHAIRAMMWDYGIGIDCSGYVQQAFLACRGLDPTSPIDRAKFGFAAAIGNEGLLGVPTSPKFRAVDAAACKPGDLMLLAKPPGDIAGHTLLVRSHTKLDDAWRKDLIAHNEDPRVRAFLSGDVHVVEVDSSWGGGTEGTGGLARETFLYDASTKTWASWGSDGLVTLSSESGPYAHPMQGIYRPKSEP